MKDIFMDEAAIAVQAVKEAALLCQDVQSRIIENVLEKDDRSPVTIADFGSQALICRALREAFPDDPVMAEENSDSLKQPGNDHILSSVMEHVRISWPEAVQKDICSWIDHGDARDYEDRLWILDPIDGTKGFVRGDQYAIALALLEDGEVTLGVLSCPNLAAHSPEKGNGTILIAQRDEGAFQLPIDGDLDDAEEISVSDTSDSFQARFCESFVSAHSSRGVAAATAEELGISREPVRIDSQAKYGIVARGEVDIYLRLPRGGYVEKVWDHAAGKILVEEAGGKVTDMTGKALDFSHGRLLKENKGIVATNGFLHADVLEALQVARP